MRMSISQLLANRWPLESARQSLGFAENDSAFASIRSARFSLSEKLLTRRVFWGAWRRSERHRRRRHRKSDNGTNWFEQRTRRRRDKRENGEPTKLKSARAPRKLHIPAQARDDRPDQVHVPRRYRRAAVCASFTPLRRSLFYAFAVTFWRATISARLRPSTGW